MDNISMDKIKDLRDRIEVGRGDRIPQVLLKGGKVVNVFTGEIYEANVAIHKGIIAGVGDYYKEGEHVYPLEDLYLIPGLVDAHIHIESSLLSPSEFARAVLPHGTTSVIWDPHEIANVMGIDGVRYVLEASGTIPLDIFITASSCVPATPFETAGATIRPGDIKEMVGWERVVGLAEMMNIPGVLNGSDKELEKIAIVKEARKRIDGHSPFLSGRDLNAYVGTGIYTDHESTKKEEAFEKLRLGMYLMIREGSVAHNMEELVPLVSPATMRRCIFVSDDKHPGDLLREGHMDHILRRGVHFGLDPVTAIQMVTINPAIAYGLDGIGAIAPGYTADIVAVDDLKGFYVRKVFKKGEPVAVDGKMVVDVLPLVESRIVRTMNVKDFSLDRLKIRIRGKRIRVIQIIPDQIYTRHIIEEVPVNRHGEIIADPSRDLLKVTVIERHHATGNIGIGFVRGFGLRHGAIGSSVAHDSHNIIVIGTNDGDMYMAALKIIEMGGGHVIVSGGEVLETLPLPVVGILSDKSLEEVVQREDRLNRIAAELGVKPSSPFITLSFLTLAVVPELKITDKGLIDVNTFEIVNPFL